MANVPGSPGDDVLLGTAETDTIDGIEGNDVLAGLDGADGIAGGPGNNVIVGGRGDDTMTGGDNDIFIWNNGDGTDLVDGGGGTDVQIVNGAAAADDFRVDADATGTIAVFQRISPAPFAITMNNIETLDVRGSGGNDAFAVADLRNTDITQVVFRGGLGADTVHAPTSRTPLVVFGEDDNDTITTGLGNDWIDGGTGADTVIDAGGIDTVVIELADVVQVPRTSQRPGDLRRRLPAPRLRRWQPPLAPVAARRLHGADLLRDPPERRGPVVRGPGRRTRSAPRAARALPERPTGPLGPAQADEGGRRTEAPPRGRARGRDRHRRAPTAAGHGLFSLAAPDGDPCAGEGPPGHAAEAFGGSPDAPTGGSRSWSCARGRAWRTSEPRSRPRRRGRGLDVRPGEALSVSDFW